MTSLDYTAWQYNGLAPWEDIIEWCSTTFGNGVQCSLWNEDMVWYTNGFETIYFKDKEDLVLFVLRWGI